TGASRSSSRAASAMPSSPTTWTSPRWRRCSKGPPRPDATRANRRSGLLLFRTRPEDARADSLGIQGMDTYMLVTLGGIAVLLVFSAFFSGSETALTAASQPRMHQLERQGDRHARIVNRLLEEKERFIGAILLGNNAVNIL